MKLLSWINGIWVLAIILELTGASCTTHQSAVPVKDGVVSQGPQAKPPPSSEAGAVSKVKVQESYGQLPLSFETNQGQSDGEVKFLSRGSGYSLFLTPTEAVLALHKPEPKAKGKGQKPVLSLVEGAKGKREEQEKTDLAQLETPNSKLETVVRMRLVDANPNPQVAGLEELPGKSHYFIGSDPQKWHTNIPTYAKVKYQDVYPGVDLIYYGNQRQLEYDFVVAPGADPEVIQLAFEGLPPHPVPLPPGEREPMPSVFAPSPLVADRGRYHEPKDSKAGLHPLSDSPPSKGERKEVPSPSKGEGEDGGESGSLLRRQRRPYPAHRGWRDPSA